MRIVFLHPDLGIGGAERLIVDSALALQSKGHEVNIVTNHHHKGHCFKETRDGTINVTVVASKIPRNIFGRFSALFAYLRLIMASIWLTLLIPADHQLNDADIIFVDQISAPILFIKLINFMLINILGLQCRRPKVIFYCHFPDQLLTRRLSLLKQLYRFPIDYLEEYSTGLADVILVNSKFTESVFRMTFKSLSSVRVQVLYPSVHFDSFNKPIKALNQEINLNKSIDTLFVSINRFERKKNLELAIKSFGELISKLIDENIDSKRCHLIIAGGYDVINEENVEYFNELKELTRKLNLLDQVTFIKNLTEDDKQALLHSSSAIIYTPSNEHFGIVPMEAMYMRRPVIAVASGGPLETIVDQETGFLCKNISSDEENISFGDQFSFKNINNDSLITSFSEAMYQIFKDKSLSREMGSNGRERVEKYFSYSTFCEKLNDIILKVNEE